MSPVVIDSCPIVSPVGPPPPDIQVYTRGATRHIQFPFSPPPIVPAASAPDDDSELPIATRKGKRSCTFHPIASHVSYDHLSLSYRAFVTSLSTVSLSLKHWNILDGALLWKKRFLLYA